jgi:N-acetylglucosaminyl-diphospho-decaprenol L-rhamnosyltransferase
MAVLPSHAESVAVLTVSYNSDDVLPGFLASIPRAVSSGAYVVIADNLPSLSTKTIASTAGAHYLPLHNNPGYGTAMDLAAAQVPASIEWLLVSNPDVVLRPGAIDRLLMTATTDSRIASIGPAVLTPDGQVYPSARAIPSLRTGIGHALFANIWIGNPWSRAYRNDTDVGPVARDAGWLSGSCLLVRRSAFDAIGGFDREFFMYFEDVDLGYRFGQAGYRNVYEPAAVVEHTGAHSTGSESVRMIAAHHASASRFLGKKYAGWWLWPVRVALGISLTVRSSLLSRRAARTTSPSE